MLSDQVHQQHDAVAPPGLRMGNGHESCANCQFFKPTSVSAGTCQKYGDYPVRPSQVCNSWAARPAENQAQQGIGQAVGQPQVGGPPQQGI